MVWNLSYLHLSPLSTQHYHLIIYYILNETNKNIIKSQSFNFKTIVEILENPQK